jgi:hypothetical protein
MFHIPSVYISLLLHMCHIPHSTPLSLIRSPEQLSKTTLRIKFYALNGREFLMTYLFLLRSIIFSPKYRHTNDPADTNIVT